MSSKMDAILALDRRPFLAFDPLPVCDGVEFLACSAVWRVVRYAWRENAEYE